MNTRYMALKEKTGKKKKKKTIQFVNFASRSWDGRRSSQYSSLRSNLKENYTVCGSAVKAPDSLWLIPDTTFIWT